MKTFHFLTPSLHEPTFSLNTSTTANYLNRLNAKTSMGVHLLLTMADIEDICQKVKNLLSNSYFGKYLFPHRNTLPLLKCRVYYYF